MKEAMLYTKEADRKVRCHLCRHGCLIAEGNYGICNVRKNEGGALYSIFYGKPIAMSVDPIEKKPLFHYKPGSTSFSIATPGCNFQCGFCQNWEISQYGREEAVRLPSEEVSPQSIVGQASAHRCASISYTYTEPTIFFEYAHDIGKLAVQQGLGNIFVTNGYMTREAIEAMAGTLHAANVDLKSFRKDTYRKVMKAQLDGVLDSIRTLHQAGVWIEITTLIVPGMNDDPRELADIARFIVETGREIPWHVSRFTPRYQMDHAAPTPEKTIRQALEIGRKAGLRYVYAGNLPGDEAEHTRCSSCQELLIEREGFAVLKNVLDHKGACPKCGMKLDGVF